MPDWVKEASQQSIENIDYEQHHLSSNQNLIDVLKTNIFTERALLVAG
jgi:hypothetical protein